MKDGIQKIHIKGFTLIEFIVAMTIFLVIISISIGIFVSALRSQRAVVGLMEVNDNASLTLEQMTREMRTGSKFASIIIGSQSLFKFIDSNGKWVYYKLEGNSIKRGISNDVSQEPSTYEPIIAENVIISKLNFLIQGDPAKYPPRITISISVGSNSQYLNGFYTNVQTTVSPLFF